RRQLGLERLRAFRIGLLRFDRLRLPASRHLPNGTRSSHERTHPTPGTMAPGHPRTWAPGHPGTRAPGHPGTRAPGHPGTRAPGTVHSAPGARTAHLASFMLGYPVMDRLLRDLRHA